MIKPIMKDPIFLTQKSAEAGPEALTIVPFLKEKPVTVRKERHDKT